MPCMRHGVTIDPDGINAVCDVTKYLPVLRCCHDFLLKTNQFVEITLRQVHLKVGNDFYYISNVHKYNNTYSVDKLKYYKICQIL